MEGFWTRMALRVWAMLILLFLFIPILMIFLYAFNQSNIDVDATFNFTPYLVAAFLFVLVTIPLARFTDWLAARDRRRFQAQGIR